MSNPYEDAKKTARQFLADGADPAKLADLASFYEERAPMVTLGTLDAIAEHEKR